MLDNLLDLLALVGVVDDLLDLVSFGAEELLFYVILDILSELCAILFFSAVLQAIRIM